MSLFERVTWHSDHFVPGGRIAMPPQVRLSAVGGSPLLAVAGWLGRWPVDRGLDSRPGPCRGCSARRCATRTQQVDGWVRRAINERDGRTCALCGRQEQLGRRSVPPARPHRGPWSSGPHRRCVEPEDYVRDLQRPTRQPARPRRGAAPAAGDVACQACDPAHPVWACWGTASVAWT